MELALWHDITSLLQQPQWWLNFALTAVAVACVLAALAGCSAVADRFRKGAGGLSSRSNRTFFLTISALFVLLIGLFFPLLLSLAAPDPTDEIEDLVATYLHDELGMVPMSPVEYRTPLLLSGGVEKGVYASVVQEDGTLADVVVTWHPVTARPHDEAWEVPENFNPISVKVTPAH